MPVLFNVGRQRFYIRNDFFVILPALAFAILGSVFATKISAEVLKKAFGYFLILLGGTYFISCFVKKIREK